MNHFTFCCSSLRFLVVNYFLLWKTNMGENLVLWETKQTFRYSVLSQCSSMFLHCVLQPLTTDSCSNENWRPWKTEGTTASQAFRDTQRDTQASGKALQAAHVGAMPTTGRLNGLPLHWDFTSLSLFSGSHSTPGLHESERNIDWVKFCQLTLRIKPLCSISQEKTGARLDEDSPPRNQLLDNRAPLCAGASAQIKQPVK